MMYLKRQAEDDLRQALASGKVTLLLGARQVGKTTLVEQVLRSEDARFLNFDVEIDKAQFLAAAALAPAIFSNPESGLAGFALERAGQRDTLLPVTGVDCP